MESNDQLNSISFARREEAQKHAIRWNLENWTVDKIGKRYILRWKTRNGPQPAPKEHKRNTNVSS